MVRYISALCAHAASVLVTRAATQGAFRDFDHRRVGGDRIICESVSDHENQARNVKTSTHRAVASPPVEDYSLLHFGLCDVQRELNDWVFHITSFPSIRLLRVGWGRGNLRLHRLWHLIGDVVPSTAVLDDESPSDTPIFGFSVELLVTAGAEKAVEHFL